MKLLGSRIYRGRNVYHARSVLRAVLDPGGSGRLAAAVLQARAASRLPVTPALEVVHERMAALCAGGAEIDRADLVGALALGLQEERFESDWRFWVRDVADKPERILFVECSDPEVTRRAAVIAVEIAAILAADDDDPAAGERLAARTRAFAAARGNIRFNWITQLLAEAARARGVPVMKLHPDSQMALFGQGRHGLRLQECVSDATSALAGRIARDKHLTLKLLAAAHVPVPRQWFARSPSEIAAAIRDIGFPLVVKGRTSDHGSSVTTGIASEAELARAIRRVQALNDEVLIEKHVAGEDFRFTVIGGRLAGAIRRIPPQVTGDGRDSVAALVARENQRRRGAGRYARWINPIALDEEAAAMLARVGMTADSVPEAGQVVRLRGAANLSQGGLAVDVTDAVHPDVVRVVERAARAIGVDICGIDVIATDIGRPLQETGGVVIEVNASPGLRPHYVTPTPARDVAGRVIDHLFPGEARGRIPTFAVSGTNGKTTTSRMIARILEAAGLTVGMATTADIRIGTEVIAKGDLAGGGSALTILRDPRVEAGVFEIARGTLIRDGTQIDEADVSVVTNVEEDHIGLDGVRTLAAMAKVKRLVAELARKAVVLNAGNEYCRGMPAQLPQPVWWVAAAGRGAVPAGHLAAGGHAVVVERTEGVDSIVHLTGDRGEVLMAVADIPATLGGIVPHNVENALCAAAACLAAGLPAATVRAGLARFDNSFAVSPGRLNIREVDGVRIIFDYVHNNDGLERVNAVIRQLGVAGRRIFVTTRAVNRVDHYYRSFAMLAAGMFDHFIVTEFWQKWAPRQKGEVAQMLLDGLREAGVAEDRFSAAPDLATAVDRAFRMLRPGDLLLVGGDDDEAIWRKIEAFRLPGAAA